MSETPNKPMEWWGYVLMIVAVGMLCFPPYTGTPAAYHAESYQRYREFMWSHGVTVPATDPTISGQIVYGYPIWSPPKSLRG